jgi:hypothetical protein
MFSAFSEQPISRFADLDPEEDVFMPEAEQGRSEQRKSKKSPEEDPDSLESKNSRGIFDESKQTLNEFLATQSYAYKVRHMNQKLQTDMMRGLEKGTDEYKRQMRLYRKQALENATEALMKDEKMPSAWSRSMRWYKALNDNNLPQMYCEPMSYEVDSFANMILRQAERLESLFNFGQMLESALLISIAFQSATAFSQKMVIHPVMMGGHSVGKSYTLTSIGKTLSEGIWCVMTQHSAKSMATAGDSSCKVHYIDEASADNVGANIDNQNDEKTSLFKAIVTDPIVMSSVTHHNSEERKRLTDKFVQIHHCVFAQNYDGRQPKSNSSVFQRLFPIYVDNIPTTDAHSITKLQNMQVDSDMDEFKEGLLHVEQLNSFFCMLTNYLIFTKVIRSPNLNGFKRYLQRFEANMARHGYTIVNSKKNDQLTSIALNLTVRYATYVAMLSDATKSLRFDSEAQKYRSVFYNLPTYVNLMSAHMFTTRAISIFTLSLGRALFGSSLGPRIADAMYQARIKDTASEFFTPECLGGVDANGKPKVRVGDDDGVDDEDSPEDIASRAEALPLDVVQGKMEKMTITPPEQRQLGAEERSSEPESEEEESGASPGLEEDFLRTLNSMPGRPNKEVIDPIDSNPAPGPRFEESQKPPDPLETLLLISGFELSYGDNSEKQINPNYIELRTNGVFTVQAAASTLQNYFTGSRPSIDSLVAALNEMATHRISVPLLQLDTGAARVKLLKKNGKSVNLMQPVVKIPRNTTKYGKNSTHGVRVFILTQYLLQRLSQISATKDSLRGLAFNNSIPGRFLTSIPMYISRYGLKSKNAVRKCEPTIMSMISIKSSNEVWVVSNPSLTSIGNIESMSQAMAMPNAILRKKRPQASTILSSQVIEMEPEIMAAIETADLCAVEDSYREYVYPVNFEVFMHSIRLKNIGETGGNVTYKYPQSAIEFAQERNRQHGAAELSQENFARVADCIAKSNDTVFNGAQVDAALVDVLQQAAPSAARALLFRGKDLRNFSNAADVTEQAASVAVVTPKATPVFVGSWREIEKAARTKDRASKRNLAMLSDAFENPDSIHDLIAMQRNAAFAENIRPTPCAAPPDQRIMEVLYNAKHSNQESLHALLAAQESEEADQEQAAKKQRQSEEGLENHHGPHVSDKKKDDDKSLDSSSNIAYQHRKNK